MRLTALAVIAALTGAAAYGQNVIAAKSGLVHVADGDVLVNGKPVEQKAGLFTTMRAGDILATAEGRAEVLLAPGVFVRASDHTMFKMVATELSDTRIELMEGEINVEAADAIKENKTTVIVKGTRVWIKKDGIYSFAANPAEVRVWDGEAVALENDKEVVLKDGRVLALNVDSKPAKFDTDDTDALYRWAKRRSGYISLANFSGAKTSGSSMFSGRGVSSWFWNPYFNMYTYLPGHGVWNSPFGCRFFSPQAYYSSYYPVYIGGGSNSGYSPSRPSWNSDLGYSTMPSRSSGNYGGGGYSGGGGGGAVSAPSGGGVSRGGGGDSIGRAGGGRGN